MPQPLSKLLKKIDFSFTTDIFDKRADLLRYALAVIITAAEAETWVGRVLVGLSLKDGLRLAHALNQSDSDSKKLASFTALTAVLLDKEKQALLDRIVRVLRQALKMRHPFAHHMYGYAVNDEEALLLVDPKDELIHRAKFTFAMGKLPKGPGAHGVEAGLFAAVNKELDEAHEEYTTRIMVYKLKEIRSIIDKLHLCAICLKHFWMVTEEGHSPDLDDQILAQLHKDLETME